MIFKVRTAFAGFGLLCLTACGTAYISPDVSQFAGEGGVQVVELSPAVVAQANRSAYQPQALAALELERRRHVSQYLGVERVGRDAPGLSQEDREDCEDDRDYRGQCLCRRRGRKGLARGSGRAAGPWDFP